MKKAKMPRNEPRTATVVELEAVTAAAAGESATAPTTEGSATSPTCDVTVTTSPTGDVTVTSSWTRGIS